MFLDAAGFGSYLAKPHEIPYLLRGPLCIPL
jgi:hypothetical protein